MKRQGFLASRSLLADQGVNRVMVAGLANRRIPCAGGWRNQVLVVLSMCANEIDRLALYPSFYHDNAATV